MSSSPKSIFDTVVVSSEDVKMSSESVEETDTPCIDSLGESPESDAKRRKLDDSHAQTADVSQTANGELKPEDSKNQQTQSQSTENGSKKGNGKKGNSKGDGKNGKNSKGQDGKKGDGKKQYSDSYHYFFPVGEGESAKEDIPDDEQCRFHFKCGKFQYMTSDEVGIFLKDSVKDTYEKQNLGKLPRLIDVFKIRHKDFAFIGLLKKDYDSFMENIVLPKKLKCKNAWISIKDATTRVQPAPEKAEDEGRDRFGYKKGVMPTIAMLKEKLSNWSRQKNVELVDKAAPLYTQYTYETQKQMKGQHIRYICKKILKSMREQCDKTHVRIPDWANIEKANHGIKSSKEVISMEEDSMKNGYRNKCEMSTGVADVRVEDSAEGTTTTQTNSKQACDAFGPIEVGFIQRMEHSNEQVVSFGRGLPHIPEIFHRISEKFRFLIEDSGLPVYRRHREKRSGFWRLIMARVVDNERDAETNELLPIEKQPVMLTIQTTQCTDTEFVHDISKLIHRHFLLDRDRKGQETKFGSVNVKSIFLQMSDAMSDAFEAGCDVVKMFKASKVAAGGEEAVEESVEESVQESELSSNKVNKFIDYPANANEATCVLPYPLEGLKRNVKRRENFSSKDIMAFPEDSLKRKEAMDPGSLNETMQFIAGLIPHPKLAAAAENNAGSNGAKNDEAAAADDANDVTGEPNEDVDMDDGNDENDEEEEEEDKAKTARAAKRARKKLKEKQKKEGTYVPEIEIPQQVCYHIFGDETLEIPLFGLRFAVGPHSFFQTNSVMCEKLYRQALEWAGIMPELEATEVVTPCGGANGAVENGSAAAAVEAQVYDAKTEVAAENAESTYPKRQLILDICSGVGTIGCIAAKLLGKEKADVIGIELVEQAVQSAMENKHRNKLTNCHFLAGRAEQVLPELFSYLQKQEKQVFVPCENPFTKLFQSLVSTSGVKNFDFPIHYESITAIVDPPRVGLHKEVLKGLRENKAIDRIVYISCNPDSLAEDVQKLCLPKTDEDKSYFVPMKAIGVDMFPHTIHLEAIVYLERYDGKKHDLFGQAAWVGKPKCEPKKKKGMYGRSG